MFALSSVIQHFTLVVLFSFCLAQADQARADQAGSISFDLERISERNILPRNWRLRVHAGTADLEVLSEGGEHVLHMKCKESSFSIERKAYVDSAEYPYINWTWKALKIPAHGDVRVSDRNDQALQVLVAFDNRKVISYVWDSNAPEGTVSDESTGWPFNLAVKVIVVRSGHADTGKWITQTRNINKDYKALFNEQPPHITGIRIQTNTQYTKDSAEGMIKGIIFRKALSAAATP
jgi:hypothetical protein